MKVESVSWLYEEVAVKKGDTEKRAALESVSLARLKQARPLLGSIESSLGITVCFHFLACRSDPRVRPPATGI